MDDRSSDGGTPPNAPPNGVPVVHEVQPPTNEHMDRIYDAVLQQFAARLEVQPDEVEVDPRKHPSFYRALMHSAWLDGALTHGVAPCPVCKRRPCEAGCGTCYECRHNGPEAQAARGVPILHEGQQHE